MDSKFGDLGFVFYLGPPIPVPPYYCPLYSGDFCTPPNNTEAITLMRPGDRRDFIRRAIEYWEQFKFADRHDANDITGRQCLERSINDFLFSLGEL